MSDNRYILTIQSANIFKEVGVSQDTPLLKIGTLQDCDVRLNRDYFDIPVCLTVYFKDNLWRISCADDLFLSSSTVGSCMETAIRHGDVLSVSVAGGEELFTLSFSYDFTVGAIDFDTIIDIRNASRVIIGNTAQAQIKLGSAFVGKEYITLSYNSNGVLFFDASAAPTSATLNGARIFKTTKVRDFDFIGIADYSFYYKNQVLYTTKRKDLLIEGIGSQPLRSETPAFDYPKLNRSPRMRYAFSTKPIEILNPPRKPQKPRDNIAMMLAPAFLMALVIVITRSGIIPGLNMGGGAFMIFSLATMSVGILTSVMAFTHNRKMFRKDLAQWHLDYRNYIAQKRIEIETEQKKELDALIDAYPSTDTLRDFVKTFSGRLYERSPKDNDFLHVRVGLGSVPALREPTFNDEEKIKLENELMSIPPGLCKEYRLIHNAPVMLHLRESGNVGVVGTGDRQYEFFKQMLLDLCIHSHFEDVQVVVLIPPHEQKKYEWIKWLAHLKESGGGVRGIVCSNESRDNVFEYLYAVMVSRYADASESGTRDTPVTPYFVVFVLEEYGLKTHPLFHFAEECSKLSFSFVYFKKYQENLPQYCKEIVRLLPDGGTLLNRDDKAFSCFFAPEAVRDDSIAFAVERLAPVYCEKIALSSRLITNISLFELLNIITPEDLNLIERWSKSNVQKSLSAPLGINVKGEVQALDLHEKAHGPHGLVAGTTGSGKSEIMQSYILSAAVNFHPYEVAFVIIDFKGGGMANQFENLPHLVGKITDIDNHEINRSLLSIRAELEKRKRLFAQFEVNHIDDYIAKFRSKITKTALPHLILIVDEFAELKAEQPEFMKELISTARVGRSLGIHLILATQKPAGQVSEQIWSNSRFKLCLKVATKEDSNEVLRSPLASEIREPGRAYLQVGNNEIFTLFQSAYSGASVGSDNHGNIREFAVSEVSFTGVRKVVYKQEAERTADGEKVTQLDAMVNYLSAYCENMGISRLPNICPPPLPGVIPYKTDKTLSVGIYDNPANQEQPEVNIELGEGNLMVVGSAQTGKTMLLQTILRSIAENSSPKQTAVYILDFASKILKMYENLNHVGGVLTDADDERLKNFFKLMDEEIEARKNIFAQLGIGSYETYGELKTPDHPHMPRIVVMIDNFALFKDVYAEYEDSMLNICREGLALGITVIATAKQTTGLSYKYFSNFATRLAFNCTESSEYGVVFDKCRISPRDLPGRGLVSVDKIIYEFQAYLPYDGDSESKRTEQAREFVAAIAKKYGAERAREIPSIPAVLTDAYWAKNALTFADYVVPVGLTNSEIEPVTIELSRVGAVGIFAKEGFGTSNLIRIVMNYLQKNVFTLPSQVYLLDGYDRRLSEFETFGIVERHTIDCSELEEILQIFGDAADSRMDTLKIGGKLDAEPLMLCVIQNPQIFETDAIPRSVSDRFKKLTADARKLKICFIVADIDNNPDYSAPEMLKHIRNFPQFFMLDDIANVKFFGTGKFNAGELREFKKAILVGDGYTLNSGDAVQKIKLVKCDGRQ